jgi:hypothetical protein
MVFYIFAAKILLDTAKSCQDVEKMQKNFKFSAFFVSQAPQDLWHGFCHVSSVAHVGLQKKH